MMNFYKKRGLWGLFIIIPMAFVLLFAPVTAFAKGENAQTVAVQNVKYDDDDDKDDDKRDKKAFFATKKGDNEPVVQKEFNEFKALYKTETANKISKDDAEKLIREKMPDENLFTLLLAAMGVSVVLAILGFVFGIKANGKLVNLEKANEKQYEKIQNLRYEIDDLKQKINRLEFQKETAASAYKPQTEERTQFALKEAAPAVKVEPKTDPVAEFLAEYHKLNTLNSFEGKEFRKNLISKYRLKAFSCTNFSERMQNPSLSPIYADVDPVKAHIWAYPLGDGNFAAVPRISQTYDETLHDPGSMGMIFNSNFANGKIYNKIEVIKPAVFTEGWRLQTKGEIRLS